MGYDAIGNQMTQRSHERVESEEDLQAFAAARRLCRQHTPEFSFFAELLPRPKRDAACVVIVFARMIRDAIVQSATESLAGARGLREHPVAVSQAGACCSSSPESIDGLLAMFRERLDQIYDHRLELPSPASRSEQQHAMHAFALSAARFDIPRQCFEDIAEALRIEASVARHATVRSFETYLDLSGGALARAVACVLGMTDSHALDSAGAVGKAVRLTRAVHNIAADFAEGRIILPLEELARHRYSERDLAAGATSAALRDLIHAQTARARRWLEEATGVLGLLAGDRERLATAWLISASERRLQRIEKWKLNDLLTPRASKFSIPAAVRLLPRAWRMTRKANRLRESQRV